MGRKIPARKHHGIRDPLVQKRKKFLEIRDKIDNPPTKIDDQEVSNKMKEFIKIKNITKQGKISSLRHQEDVPKNPIRPYKDLPEFQMRKKEKAKDFLRRVHHQTQSKLKEAHYEAKYSVDVVKKENGDVEVKKRTPVELETISGKDKLKGIRKRKEKLDKKKIKREKKQKIREELEAEKNKMYQREDIKFGEICHAPPQLKVIPRLAEAPETVARPGKKKLLLHSLIEEEKPGKKMKPDFDIGIKLKTGKLNLKGKRKDLPMRTREILESEQRSVIDQYREIKKKNSMK